MEFRENQFEELGNHNNIRQYYSSKDVCFKNQKNRIRQ